MSLVKTFEDVGPLKKYKTYTSWKLLGFCVSIRCELVCLSEFRCNKRVLISECVDWYIIIKCTLSTTLWYCSHFLISDNLFKSRTLFGTQDHTYHCNLFFSHPDYHFIVIPNTVFCTTSYTNHRICLISCGNVLYVKCFLTIQNTLRNCLRNIHSAKRAKQV